MINVDHRIVGVIIFHAMAVGITKIDKKRIADAVAEQEGARLPGADRKEMDLIDVPDALWALVTGLAHPKSG